MERRPLGRRGGDCDVIRLLGPCFLWQWHRGVLVKVASSFREQGARAFQEPGLAQGGRATAKSWLRCERDDELREPEKAGGGRRAANALVRSA
ncbi:hypothetical protein NDU88_008363 [Pleurodeles waltl]|uniref:Uncharacterized protein n=1 Tax=Pleurodeles waltl TaxID=8319 RepID=A0AAV7NZ14_PLEWA|nr:hypothetical protein NDU88_008363 [Pleurodeles waltl]